MSATMMTSDAPDTTPRTCGEGPAHRMAKRTMIEQFGMLGYGVVAEENYGDRRVDVAVTVRPGCRVAVELQGRPISPAAMQARMGADLRHGFFGTLWVWVGARAGALKQAGQGGARLPAEMRWLAARDRIGLFALQDGTLHRYNLTTVTRWPDQDFNDWRESEGLPRLGPRRLKTMRRAWAEPCSFALTTERPPGTPSTARPARIPSFGPRLLSDVDVGRPTHPTYPRRRRPG
jgi:hypothetical protein